MFNWPDGDVILRATHGTGSRDFRVHKVFLSFSSPVFKDMFKIPQPPPAISNDVDVVEVTDPPRAWELVLRFVYPSLTSPPIDNLTILSEALVAADKYDIKVARSRLQSSFKEFAVVEPLRVYAIACRLGIEEEMRIASSHTTSIHLPGLTELPDEFKFVPATEYHRLILLHSRFRKEVEEIAHSAARPTRPTVARGSATNLKWAAVGWMPASSSEERWGALKAAGSDDVARANVEEVIKGGIPLNYESFKHAWKAKYGTEADGSEVQAIFLSILDQANSLNLTV